MEVVMQWVRSGLLFGIVASVVLMLSPNKTYAKHISMVVGLLFILVMIHPVMELFHVEKGTYMNYMKNLVRMETDEGKIEEEDLEYYEEITAYQLMISLQEMGYTVNKAEVTAGEDGVIEKIKLNVEDEIRQLEKVEIYLKNMYGEDVKISYEME